MELLKLRGYVKPEEMNGNEEDRLQAAIDLAVKEDIRKVVLGGTYRVASPVKLPSGIEIVLKDGAKVIAENGPAFITEVACEPGKNTWSFENARIYLKGEGNAEIAGGLTFYHAKYVVLENLTVTGTIFYEFAREIRMEYDTINGSVVLGRGCNNFIMQYLTVNGKENAFVIDTKIECGEYVIGKDAEIHEIILRDVTANGEYAVRIDAAEKLGVFNCQIDHIQTNGAGVVIGDGKGLPKERFFNLTVTDVTGENAKVDRRNETKHCYFGE